jgi:prevent-host-death family protein
MRTVGLRELKNRLSTYVRRAQEGETVIVTDRGEAIAELVPARGNRSFSSGLELLARRGELTLAVRANPRKRRALYRAMPKSLRFGSASELLDAERGDTG